MARLVLVGSKKTAVGSDLPEGEQALQLLEAHGFQARTRTPRNGQYEFACPFHEGDLAGGSLPHRHSTNFYLDAQTSKYYCQAASCRERGNLQTLQSYFGVEKDPVALAQWKSKETKLKEFEAALTPERREKFKEAGLLDETIERFRFGFDETRDHYVIPYLQGRRPVAFRFWNPDPLPDRRRANCTECKTTDVEHCQGHKEPKYYWEPGTESMLFNVGDAVGKDNRVFLVEGEKKAALLWQWGYAAVGVPGASQWKKEWSHEFNHAKEIIVCFDNDNPASHVYADCRRCAQEYGTCQGHNPGQEGASKVCDSFGFRARNVLLPRTDDQRKTDLNDFAVRDERTMADFDALVFGTKSPFANIRTLAEIREDPPDESVFIVDSGILARGGRLLVSGAPKVGKSLFVENLALSIASGMPFLRRFKVLNEGVGHRVLLLDREISSRSLYDRMDALVAARPGYALGEKNLLIDHKLAVQLDDERSARMLVELVREKAVEVIIFDTAYKFFDGSMESTQPVKKAFAALDYVIAETDVAVVLTHHHRKRSKSDSTGKEAIPHPDEVVGSFLWTGWPNGTVLLNFLNRRVESPFNVVSSFTAFRDAPPPEPLALYRDRESLAYTSILDHSWNEEEETVADPGSLKLSYDRLAQFLLENTPVLQDEFLYKASLAFGCKPATIELQLLDILDRHPDFMREGDGSRGKPYVWKFKFDKEEETYEQEAEQLGLA